MKSTFEVYFIIIFMNMILFLGFLLSAVINKIQCAPKLGYDLFDPLLHELKLASSSKELPIAQKTFLKESLRQLTRIKETSKTPLSGYDYNENLCKTVDDRVICGYNKNIGNLSNQIVNIGNKCRIRGDRLECGYMEGPYKLPRRPPANEAFDTNDKSLHLRYRPTRTTIILTKVNVTHKPNNSKVNFTASQQTQKLKFNADNATKTSIVIVKSSLTTSSILKTSLLNKSSFLTASRPTSSLTSIRPTISRRQFKVKKLKRFCIDKSDSIFCQSIE